MIESKSKHFFSDNPSAEENRAIDDLFSLVYEELRRIASIVRRNEASATLSSTALLHEAWMRLRGFATASFNVDGSFQSDCGSGDAPGSGR